MHCLRYISRMNGVMIRVRAVVTLFNKRCNGRGEFKTYLQISNVQDKNGKVRKVGVVKSVLYVLKSFQIRTTSNRKWSRRPYQWKRWTQSTGNERPPATFSNVKALKDHIPHLSRILWNGTEKNYVNIYIRFPEHRIWPFTKGFIRLFLLYI